MKWNGRLGLEGFPTYERITHDLTYVRWLCHEGRRGKIEYSQIESTLKKLINELQSCLFEAAKDFPEAKEPKTPEQILRKWYDANAKIYTVRDPKNQVKVEGKWRIYTFDEKIIYEDDVVREGFNLQKHTGLHDIIDQYATLNTISLPLPTREEVFAHIFVKTHERKTETDRILYDFGEDLPCVEASLLLDMIDLFGNGAAAYIRSHLDPIYFVGLKKAALLFPVRK